MLFRENLLICVFLVVAAPPPATSARF